MSWAELPEASATELTVAVISALGHWGAHITDLSLHRWRVDAAIIRAISTHLPRCNRLAFFSCDVSSMAWVEMHGLPPPCTTLCIGDSTAVTLADLMGFAHTVKREMDISIRSAVVVDASGANVRGTLPALLPALTAHQLRVGLPPCDIIV